MSAENKESTVGEEKAETQDKPNTSDETHKQSDGDVDLSEEGRQEVHDIVEAYEDKPTAVLPGRHGTITGTAINEWLDEDGNPKYVDPEEHPFADEGDKSGESVQARLPRTGQRTRATSRQDVANGDEAGSLMWRTGSSEIVLATERTPPTGSSGPTDQRQDKTE
jgi:hypothetical protein